MTAFDGPVRDSIEYLQAAYDLTRGKALNFELSFGELANAFAHLIGRTVNRIEALRPAGCHSPTHLVVRLRQSGRGDGGHRQSSGCLFQKCTSLHFKFPLLMISKPNGFSLTTRNDVSKAIRCAPFELACCSPCRAAEAAQPFTLQRDAPKQFWALAVERNL